MKINECEKGYMCDWCHKTTQIEHEELLYLIGWVLMEGAHIKMRNNKEIYVNHMNFCSERCFRDYVTTQIFDPR